MSSHSTATPTPVAAAAAECSEHSKSAKFASSTHTHGTFTNTSEHAKDSDSKSKDDEHEPADNLTEMKEEDWAMVSKLPGNDLCVDCNAKYPEWGSVNFGILFCTRCCSGHRYVDIYNCTWTVLDCISYHGFILLTLLNSTLLASYKMNTNKYSSLGTHISRVRSVRMDAWTDKQVKIMKAGGNKSMMHWFDKHDLSATSLSHKAKYDNEVARLYTEVLKARVAGRREPKSLKEAKRLKRWGKPKEWWRALLFGHEEKNPNSSMNKKSKQMLLIQRLQKLYTRSEFFMAAYLLSTTGLLLVFLSLHYYGLEALLCYNLYICHSK